MWAGENGLCILPGQNPQCTWRPSSSPAEEGVGNAETQRQGVGKSQGPRVGPALPVLLYREPGIGGQPKIPLPLVLCVIFFPSLLLSMLTYGHFLRVVRTIKASFQLHRESSVTCWLVLLFFSSCSFCLHPFSHLLPASLEPSHGPSSPLGLIWHSQNVARGACDNNRSTLSNNPFSIASLYCPAGMLLRVFPLNG